MILAAILVIAAFLRIHNLQVWSLNNDEIAEVTWSSGTLGELFKEVREDTVHPPLDYLLQFAIGKMPVPEWVRRVPYVLAGILSVAFFALLGNWWHSPRAGIASAFLLAISPMHIRYSQEVRPYATAILFVAGALVALELYAITRRRAWAVAWFVLVLLAGWTLYLAGMVVGIASIGRLFLDRQDRLRDLWRRFPLIVAGWTLLYSPWLAVIIAAARAPRPAAPETLDWYWWQHRLHAFAAGHEFPSGIDVGTWAFWILVAVGLATCVRARLLRTAAMWLLVGSAMTIVILQLRPHYGGTPRYFLAAALAAPLLAGAGIALLWKSAVPRTIAVILLATYAGFAGVTLSEYYDDGRPDWRAVAEYVHVRAKPGDAVILANNWVVRNFGFYWRRMPPLPGVDARRFVTGPHPLEGPAWIVTGQCWPRESLKQVRLMRYHLRTEISEIRYLGKGERLPIGEELCPE